jgi:Flp pilus assembly pilin Flp
MRERLHQLGSDERGAAAAEMAMVTPLLLVLLFGALETGKYFLDEHVVVKAVRDGARFAARQSFAEMPCGGPAGNETEIQNQVRFGRPNPGSAEPRLSYWDDNQTITVTVACHDNSPGADGTRSYAGVYTERDDVPYVTVSATVPYEPLAALVGLDFEGLNVTASNQAPVLGI